MKVFSIPPIKTLHRKLVVKNVAAYCRVSTKAEIQGKSLKMQISAYTDYIKKNPNWNFVGIYADTGSGRNTKRKAFQQMIQDCMDGKIDLIITKSMSRLCRNTVDFLKTCRQLKEHNVDMYFEEQNTYLSQETTELYLSVMATFFQEESYGKSENTKWGIRYRFSTGTSGFINRPCYGYKRGEDGELKIYEPEASVVRDIYSWHQEGVSLRKIASRLRRRKVKAPRGGTEWSIETIRKILNNEKYQGKVLLQKTFVTDFPTGKQVPNKGQLARYEVADVCEPIIQPSLIQMLHPHSL